MITIITNNIEKSILSSNLQRFSENDIEILFYQEPCLADAYNKGIVEASGEYIWFLTENDIPQTDAIDIIRQTIKAEQSEIFVFDYSELYEGGLKVCRHPNTYFAPAHQFIPMLTQFKYPSYIGDKIFKRSYLLNAKVLFDNELDIFADRLFMITLLKFNPKTRLNYIPENLITTFMQKERDLYSYIRHPISPKCKEEYPLYEKKVKKILGKDYIELIDQETFDFKYELSNSGLLDRSSFNTYLPTPLYLMLKKPYKLSRLLKYIAVYMANKVGIH